MCLFVMSNAVLAKMMSNNLRTNWLKFRFKNEKYADIKVDSSVYISECIGISHLFRPLIRKESRASGDATSCFSVLQMLYLSTIQLEFYSRRTITSMQKKKKEKTNLLLFSKRRSIKQKRTNSVWMKL